MKHFSKPRKDRYIFLLKGYFVKIKNEHGNVNFNYFLFQIFHADNVIIIIIIIKKDWQCKAGRGRLPPYQSEDPSHTLPTYRGKEEKGKIVEDKKVESN